MHNNNRNSDAITGWRAKIYNHLMSFLGVGRVYRAVLHRLPVKAHSRVLDIGCGTGTLLALLRAQVRLPLTLVGIDVSEDMLAEARKRLAGLRIEYQLADAAILPFPSSSFDAIVSVLAFHHMSNAVKVPAIQEMARVLKDGGRLVIADLARPARGWWGRALALIARFHSHTRENWATLLAELPRWGFRIEEETSIRGAVGLIVALKIRERQASAPSKSVQYGSTEPYF